MNTLTELMDNIKALQKGLDEVYGDIAELQETERNKENMPDIIDWLNYGSQHPLKGHPLTIVDNIEIQGIYVRLLFTVAMCHIHLNHEMSPLAYPCQLVAALGKKINGELLFKESLTLDALTIRMDCEQIKAQDIDAYFLIDALIVTGKYERDNHEKMDYIASLAAMMEVSKEKFADIITLAKNYVEESKEFVGRLMEVYTPESLYYLQSCTEFKIVETPICFVAHSEKKRACDEVICQFLPISSKVSALFSNIIFQNIPEDKMTFNDMKQLKFSNCEFKDFDHTAINADYIEKIVMERVGFMNCVYDNHISESEKFFLPARWYENYLTGSREDDSYNCDLEKLSEEWSFQSLRDLCKIPSGILGNFYNVVELVMDNVKISGCFAKHYITYSVDKWFPKQNDLKVSRGIPDYSENYLFKGMSNKQIIKNNCTWKDSCKLIGGE